MEELIEQAKNGDNDAFNNLIMLYKRELYLIAKSKLNNDDDIADCIQETILKSYKNIKQLKNSKVFKSWLIKILINECNRLYNKKEENIVSIEENNFEDIISQTNINDLKFENIISGLSDEEKLILTLFYVSGYTTKEIGKILKKNDNTIRTKMLRAKDKLRKRIEGGFLYE